MHTLKFGSPEFCDYTVQFRSDKDRVKFVKRIEKIVRSSLEYKDYIAFLKENVDMTACRFFNNVDGLDNRRIKIEIHHEPLTLYDIVNVVLEKWIVEGIPLNDLFIADEVMRLHYENKVGLIPLSKTVHQLVHDSSDIIIPLPMVYGNYRAFLDESGEFIESGLPEIIEKLERKIALTNSIKNVDVNEAYSVLQKDFEYIEVEGFSLVKQMDSPIRQIPVDPASTEAVG